MYRLTKKEQMQMRRLEAENQALREKLSKQLEVYSAMLFEVVELKARLELVKYAMGDEE